MKFVVLIQQAVLPLAFPEDYIFYDKSNVVSEWKGKKIVITFFLVPLYDQ